MDRAQLLSDKKCRCFAMTAESRLGDGVNRRGRDSMRQRSGLRGKGVTGVTTDEAKRDHGVSVEEPSAETNP